MSAKHRSNDKAFTCCNARFHTDVTKGKPHRPGQEKGSVFDGPLLDGGGDGYSLLLEHVVDKQEDDSSVFWFMWYNPNGNPTIPASGVFDLNQLREMNRRLAAFIDIR